MLTAKIVVVMECDWDITIWLDDDIDCCNKFDAFCCCEFENIVDGLVS